MIEEHTIKNVCSIQQDKHLPIEAHTLSAVRNPLDFLLPGYQYENLVKIRIAGKIYYISQNPESFRYILQENSKNYFTPGAAMKMKPFLEGGLGSSYGDIRMSQTELSHPGSHQEQFESLITILNNETDEFVRHWKRRQFPLTENISQVFSNLLVSNMTKLQGEINDIIMTWYEATAQTLGWIFYHLASNRHVYEEVREEAKTFGSGRITLNTLNNMSYTKNVIEETLRLHPPVWLIARKSIATDTISTIASVPGGSTVLLNVYGMHHHSAHWHSPQTFNPNRFSLNKKEQRHPFAYLPFGVEKRVCNCQQVAMTIIHIVISRLVQEFEFEIPAGFKPVIVPGTILRAKGGIRLIIKTR